MPANTMWPTAPPALKAGVAILSAALTPTLVSPNVPIVRPDTFVRLSLVGGYQLNLATRVNRLLVECWVKEATAGYGGAETLYAAASRALYSAAGSTFAGVFIRAWRNEDGPVDYPDPDVSDMLRLQFTGDLLVANQ